MANNLKGRYRLTPSALRYGKEWYEEWEEDKKTNPMMSSVRTASFMARKPTHLHKVAMVLAATRRDELIIDLEDLKDADLAIALVEQNLPKVFAKVHLLSGTPAMNAAPAMISLVQRMQPITRRRLYQELFNTFNLSSQDYKMLLESAVEANELNLIKVGYDVFVRPGPALGGGESCEY